VLQRLASDRAKREADPSAHAEDGSDLAEDEAIEDDDDDDDDDEGEGEGEGEEAG